MLIFLDGIGRTRSRRTYHRLLLEINKQIMSKTLMTEKWYCTWLWDLPSVPTARAGLPGVSVDNPPQ